MNPQEPIYESIQSLKALGFSDDQIALYLRQMEQFSQLYKGKAAPVNGFSPTRRHSAGVSPLIINPESKLTRPQLWAIACGADVAYGNGYFMNDLTTGLSRLECRNSLGEQYDIDCREEVMDSIDWLRNEGHRSTFDVLWQAVSKLSLKEVKDYIRDELAADVRDEAILLQRLRNIRDTKEVFEAVLEPTFQPDMLIWDFARIINLCRGSYDAGYLSDEVAMEAIMSGAEVIKKTYSSWRHLSLSYQFARFIWKGFDEDLFVEGITAMDFLLINAGSPWVTLKWEEEFV